VGHQYGVCSDGDSKAVPPKYKPDTFLLHQIILRKAMCEGVASDTSAAGEGQTASFFEGDNC